LFFGFPFNWRKVSPLNDLILQAKPQMHLSG
jgi:hypothetical protein